MLRSFRNICKSMKVTFSQEAKMRLLTRKEVENVCLLKKNPIKELFVYKPISEDTTSSAATSSSYSDESAPVKRFTRGEIKIEGVLMGAFPNAANITVIDVSGGCGSMYSVNVCTEEFRNLTILKQHRMVQTVLEQEIKDMHGITIHTSVPGE